MKYRKFKSKVTLYNDYEGGFIDTNDLVHTEVDKTKTWRYFIKKGDGDRYHEGYNYVSEITDTSYKTDAYYQKAVYFNDYNECKKALDKLISINPKQKGLFSIGKVEDKENE